MWKTKETGWVITATADIGREVYEGVFDALVKARMWETAQVKGGKSEEGA